MRSCANRWAEMWLGALAARTQTGLEHLLPSVRVLTTCHRWSITLSTSWPEGRAKNLKRFRMRQPTLRTCLRLSACELRMLRHGSVCTTAHANQYTWLYPSSCCGGQKLGVRKWYEKTFSCLTLTLGDFLLLFLSAFDVDIQGMCRARMQWCSVEPTYPSSTSLIDWSVKLAFL